MTDPYFSNLHAAGHVSADVTTFLLRAGKPRTLAHIRAVVGRARILAARYGADMKAAAVAAWCHDLAAVVPHDRIIATAEAWGVPLTESDRAVPQVVHGPLAAEVVRQKLGIADEDILNAIRYHSTLRAGASTLEKVVFVADKIALDPTAVHRDFLPALTAAAQQSIDEAAYVYLDWVMRRGPSLGWTVHEHIRAAHEALGGRYAQAGD